MTLRLPTFTAVLLAAVAAFGATLLILSSASDRGALPSSSSSTGSVALPTASTDERIAVYQRLVRSDPADVDSAVLLAGAYAQKVRETGDAALYLKADALLRGALKRRPDDVGALTQMGALALSRHDFAGGLKLAQRAHALAPDVVKPYGVMVDALVELGRYGAAGRILQRYVDEQPTLSSYARVSYFRELHGDLPGAIDALQRAASAGGEAARDVAPRPTPPGERWVTPGRPRPPPDRLPR